MRITCRILLVYAAFAVFMNMLPWGLIGTGLCLWLALNLGAVDEATGNVRDESYGYRQEKRWDKVETARRGSEIDPTRPH